MPDYRIENQPQSNVNIEEGGCNRMKIYDKASWHIDGGEKTSVVVLRFKEVFLFLLERDMLNDEGKETLEYGIDSSVSLNSTMVNIKGKRFLDHFYDDVINLKGKNIKKALESAYEQYDLNCTD